MKMQRQRGVMMKKLISLFLLIVTVFNTVIMTGCASNGNGGNDVPDEPAGTSAYEAQITDEMLDEAVANMLKKVDSFLRINGSAFPGPAGNDNIYPIVQNKSGWTTGFWTGILWNAYELAGDNKYVKVATSHVDSFHHRIVNKLGVNHHDMGFLYSPSCVSAYQLTGNETAKEAAIMAADLLITRFNEKGEFIQSSGNVGDPAYYKLIVDCLMNIPLLYWASEETGDATYRDIAQRHLKTTIRNCIREDGGSYQVYEFDPETGEALRGTGRQGVNDETTWSRGQAWVMYGTIIAYSYTRDEETLDAFKKSTEYFIENLPSDFVPYWDFSFKNGAYEPKDSSAASTAVCALLEAIKYFDEDDPLRAKYTEYADKIMYSLMKTYTTKNHPSSNGLLLHGTYSIPAGLGIDETNLWGDYFYAEALNRMRNPDWKKYW